MSLSPVDPTQSHEKAADSPVRPGDVLAGKYRVDRIIGSGAMGLVLEAMHLQLEQRVALKFLRPEAAARPDIVSRFAREARAAVKLKSDHIARVLDVGTSEDGSSFIVMEYLEGKDLGIVITESGRLEVGEATLYVIQACEALAEAHARSIIHRDVKPPNLFLVESAGLRNIKLLDFGISKASLTGTTSDVDLLGSHTTEIMGSPHYMSPEQLRSTRDVDARADLWSLGVVLFELLTGQMPFPAMDFPALVAQILHAPPGLALLQPDVPHELRNVIEKALEKDPDRRFQTAAEFAVALLPYASKRARASVERAIEITRSAGLPAPTLLSVPPPGRSDTALPATFSAVSATVPAPPMVSANATRGRGAILLAVFALLVVLGGGFVALRRNGVSTSPTESATTPSSQTSPLVAATANAARPPEPAEPSTGASKVQAPSASASSSALSAPVRLLPRSRATATSATAAAPRASRELDTDIRLER